jgi:hypothetical protein
MTRLRNETTGAIVDVPEEKVARLGSGWVEADEKKPRQTTKKAASSAKSN